jgi:Ca-activated chloride channel family protein
MTFAVPLALWGLVLVPLLTVLFVAAERRRRHDLARLAAPRLLRYLTNNVHDSNRRRKYLLYLIALTGMVLALARPQWGVEAQALEQRGLEIMVALDVSESMLAEDIAPNRLRRAKLDIRELMQRLRGDALGLVVFSGASFVQFPLTTDINTAQRFLDDAQPSLISRPGTVIGDAIRTALAGFSDNPASDRAILLFTDGEDSETDPEAAANEAAAGGVVIYTIGMGSPAGATIPNYDSNGRLLGYKQDRNGNLVTSRLDASSLEQIAAITGGQYFAGSRPGTLVLLEQALASLERDTLGEQASNQAIERFQWFLAASLLCLLTANILPAKRRSTHITATVAAASKAATTNTSTRKVST